ncbi:MAG TPA: hypothetical protein ENJ32_14495 [Crenotrichaceae bacterium]|nr:hypothetical protein [Crenotrichaceae bacterium]
MDKAFIIEARSYDIWGIASHNFWVLRNDENQVLSQLHGLATDRKTNTFKPIGFFNDRLGFYEFKTANNDPSFIFNNQQAVPVYQGDVTDVLSRWDNAASQLATLNKQDLNYSPFGILGLPVTNSNSAYHLLSQLMGIDCCRFSGVLEPGIGNSLDYCNVNAGNE